MAKIEISRYLLKYGSIGLDIQDLEFSIFENTVTKISAKIIFRKFLSSFCSMLEKILNKYAILLAKYVN